MTTAIPPKSSKCYQLRDLRPTGCETNVPVESMSPKNRREWERRQAEFEASIRADVEADEELQPVQGGRPPKRPNTRARVLAMLQSRPGEWRTGELAAALELSGSSVSEHCHQLVRLGLVRKLRCGVWEARA